MKFTQYFKEKNILLDIKASTKEEAIKELCFVLKDTNEMIDFDLFVADIMAREKLTSTGIGQEVAIPHSRTNAIEDFVLAFGRSSKGIEFNSIDGKPVRLIFLIATPKEKQTNFLKILAYLSRLLEKDAFKNALLNAASPKEIIAVFEKVK